MSNVRTRMAVISLPAALVAIITACTTSAPGPCDLADCTDPADGAAPDGNVSSDAAQKTDAEPPAGCTTPTDPTKNPEKCLVDQFGAFVSPTGSDQTGDGTKAKPFGTIGKAVGGTRTRIVVCEGTYAESVEVARGVEIYGGSSCDWTRAGGKSKIVAAQPAFGIRVSKVPGAVILADLEITGKSGAAPGESSIGVFVSESGNVKILRSKIEAGDGADAAPKRDGAFAMPAQAPNGGDAVGNTGGAATTNGPCPGGGSTTGGKGGDLGNQGTDGAPRPPGGLKGAIAACNAGGGGSDGDSATAGMPRPGAASIGTLNAVGFLSRKADDGTNGGNGGAGGGGYGSAGAGGGGGTGGCGGQGGFGAGAGGSSIALATFASSVVIEGGNLIARLSKPGGQGGAGQSGQAGGFSGNKSGGACSGGNGAKGGDGGSGGGGAGGISVGIAWAGGTEPTRDGATTITRPMGAAPAGGEGGPGATKGVDGVHGETLEIK